MRQTTLLLLTVVLGCAPQTSFISTANDSLSFRLIATTTDDPDLVRDAESQTGRLVKKDGRTIGQWVPVANSSPAATHYRELANAVTRPTDRGQEILVAHSDSDLSDIDISQLVDGGTDRNGRPTIIVHLDDADSKIFFSMTTEHVGRYWL